MCSLILMTDSITVWSSWSLWSTCTVTCGEGEQQRTRNCDGSGCSGSTVERRRCQEGRCPGELFQ